MLFIREFELFQDEDFWLALPFGMEGGTQGTSFEDAVRMATDWLRVVVLDYLMRDEEPPSGGIGNEPRHGGRTVVVAIDARLEDVPAVTAAEAARMLGVSAARVSQLCASRLLDSWKVGGTRMVSIECIEARLEEEHKAGRPRKQLVEA